MAPKHLLQPLQGSFGIARHYKGEKPFSKHPGLEKDLLYSCPDCAFRSINKDIFNTHLLTVHKLTPG
ncbi:hypothetical protein QE152_g21532 [Popillia japonica]|uniref:C2H2-type domain-containing protein n=1 Tax=Popillia japonica TaxID=7064 RepID=A0AAW1KPU6_POPJA